MVPFRCISPEWKIRSVKACTLLARDTKDNLATFDTRTYVGVACRSTLDGMMTDPVTWLNQVHGDTIVEMPAEGNPEADASYTFKKETVCAVLTADCLPVVFARKNGKGVGVVHAGRRGLEIGLLEKMIHKLGKPADLLVWIGPGIAAESYPVSAEIRDEFLKLYPEWPYVFEECTPGQFHMDLYQVAKLQLLQAGIKPKRISGGYWNTFTDFYLHSARRDGKFSGRMATMVWME